MIRLFPKYLVVYKLAFLLFPTIVSWRKRISDKESSQRHKISKYKPFNHKFLIYIGYMRTPIPFPMTFQVIRS